MEIKGTSVKITKEYIKNKFGDRYDEWLSNLSEESREIFKSIIIASNWYDLYLTQIEPQIILGKLFYDNDNEKAAYELGKYGAEVALKKIYSVFVKIVNLDFVLKQMTTIFETYFSKEVSIKVVENEKSKIVLNILGFKEDQYLQIHNIAGWIDGLLEIVSKRKYEINVDYKTGDVPTIASFIIVNFK